MSTQPLDWRRILWRGAAAGLTGGLFFGVFIFPAIRAEVSSALAALYAAACLAWGIGYSYLAETRAQLNTLPIVSGVVYGLVVYVVMQLVLYSVAAERMASALEVAYGGFATCLFFGLPIALVTRLLSNRR